MPLTTIGTDAIDALAVTSAKLAPDAVATAKIENNAVDGAKIAMTSDAQGDVLFYGGTDYERLAPGTSGKFLKTQGAAANPIWDDVPAGAPTGGGSDLVFYQNGQTVTTSYSVTASNNAMSAGPVTVASGVDVTLTGTSEWVIV